jgi:glucose/arabinose dehydrogenase
VKSVCQPVEQQIRHPWRMLRLGRGDRSVTAASRGELDLSAEKVHVGRRTIVDSSA